MPQKAQGCKHTKKNKMKNQIYKLVTSIVQHSRPTVRDCKLRRWHFRFNLIYKYLTPNGVILKSESRRDYIFIETDTIQNMNPAGVQYFGAKEDKRIINQKQGTLWIV